ncbi:MAG: SDR family oxidoreductase [Betaproteobacteria bacterium]|nr:SDR family oxidoreductase [Betaproteobacteria bacterium]
MKDLEGKVVLVTGASTGIGAAVARGFAAAGAVVAVHYSSSADAAAAVVADCRAAGAKAESFRADLTRRDTAGPLVEAVAAKFGGLDVLVNNAGGLVRRARLAEIDDALFDTVVDLNVRQLVMASRAALPFIEKTRGSIINTTSIAARNGGGPGASLYAAAKAFVSTLTKNWAKELGPKGVRVNAVSPGVIETPFHERFSTKEMLEAMRKTIPLERLGAPVDCTGTFLYLASGEMSAYVTGQIIEVNGGQLMP